MRSIDGEGSDRPNAPSCKAVQLVTVGMAEGAEEIKTKLEEQGAEVTLK